MEHAREPDKGAERDLWLSVWRTALALAGDAARARAVLAQLVAGPRTLHQLGDTRLWRAVVVGARPRDTARPWAPADPEARRLWDELERLPPAHRAAWILREIGGLDAGHIGVTLAGPGGPFAQEIPANADGRPADAAADAERALRERLGDDLAPAAASLKAEVAAVDPSPAIEEAERSAEAAGGRRRRLAAIQLAVLLVCFGLLIYVLVDLLGWDEERAAERLEAERISNPLPDDEADR